MIDEFILFAILAGLCVALPAGPMGTVLVWRRMAFFGDALSHTALLGVALGVILGANLDVSIIVICFIVAGALVFLSHKESLSADTLLGISSHGTLAIGLIALSMTQTYQTDLYALLFGDILAIKQTQLYWLGGGALVMLIAIALLWRSLLSITIHEDLAQIDGIATKWVLLLFMALMALIVSMAMKVVGVILITALLIIPAAAARRLANTPDQMAMGASLIGSASVLIGIWLSYQWDWPTGPAIVVTATAIFLILQPMKLRN